MDRLLIGQPGTLYATWERDGEPVSPGSVTVTITRDSDGSTLLSDGAAVVQGATASLLLTPAQTASLDLYTAVWIATDGSSLTTYAEVVGGYHFSIRQARLRAPLQDVQAYPTDALLYYRTLAEMALERVCGVAFVPRYSRDEARSATIGTLSLPRRRITQVLQITLASDEGPQPIPSLAGLRVQQGGQVWLPALWNFWSFPIFVAYLHGYDYCDPRVSRASLELARRWVIESPWDERMTAYRQRDGGQMEILTATGSAFDIPEVEAVAEIYGTPMIM